MDKQFSCDCSDTLRQGSLGFHRAQAPSLYDVYAKNLLQRGWAGNVNAAEQAYVKRTKIRSPKQKVADERFRERTLARRGVQTCP